MLTTWFLFVSITIGGGEAGGQFLGTFGTAGECETAKYNLADYSARYEKDNGAKVALHCVPHDQPSL